MREIKFRGKRVDNSGWSFGDFMRTPITAEFDCDGMFFDTGIGRTCIVQENVAHEIDIDTLGQFTGRKDKNGKEIYEGDLIQHIPDGMEPRPIMEIRWSEENACFSSDGYMQLVQLGMSQHRVIGNIYENPELLSKQLKR